MIISSLTTHLARHVVAEGAVAQIHRPQRRAVPQHQRRVPAVAVEAVHAHLQRLQRVQSHHAQRRAVPEAVVADAQQLQPREAPQVHRHLSRLVAAVVLHGDLHRVGGQRVELLQRPDGEAACDAGLQVLEALQFAGIWE